MSYTRFQGSFYDKEDSLVTVSIQSKTNTTTIKNKELTFTSHPCVLSMKSDGLYSPIKGTGLTINIRTDEIFWELYTNRPFEWEVIVTKKDKNGTSTTEFTGFVSPCIYSQDYSFNGELSIEATDFISNLKYLYFKPFFKDGSTTTYSDIYQMVTLKDIISYMGWRIDQEISGTKYVRLFSRATCTPSLNHMLNGYDTNKEYHYNTFNFCDEDGETITLYDVLKEICKFWGCTLTTRGNEVIFLDFNNLEQGEEIDFEHYAAGTPTIELDKMYGKTQITSNSYPIGDLLGDVYKDDDSYNVFEHYDDVKWGYKGNREYIDEDQTAFWNGNTYSVPNFYENNSEYVIKPYMFTEANKKISTPHIRINTDVATTDDNETRVNNALGSHYQYDRQQAGVVKIPTFVPYYYDAIPIKYFRNEIGMYPDYKGRLTDLENLNFNNVIAFPLFGTENDARFKYVKHTMQYFAGITTDVNFPTPYINTLAETKEAMTFKDDKMIAYSTADTISYIVINFNLFFNVGAMRYRDYMNAFTREERLKGNTILGGYKYIYSNDDIYVSNSVYGTFIAPMENKFGDINTDYSVFKEFNSSVRENFAKTWNQDGKHIRYIKDGVDNYNKGWDTVKICVKVGDKYFNGNGWQTTKCTVNIKMHNEDMSGTVEMKDKVEQLTPNTWLEIVKDPNINTIDVGKKGFYITCRPEDNIHGQLEVTFYTPMIEHDQSDTFVEDYGYTWWNDCPISFMKDLSIDYVYNNGLSWQSDAMLKDDIVYDAIVPYTYGQDNDETELMINTWNKYNAPSFSWIMDNDYKYVDKVKNPYYAGNEHYNNGVYKQEQFLLDRIYEHYTNPKKIFQVNYDKFLDFSKKHRKTFTSSDGQITANMVVDSYEYDMKLNDINVKLIEI